MPITGGHLRRRREALGQTRASLGRRWGMAASTLQRWEDGTMPIEKPGLVDDALTHLEVLDRIGGLARPSGKAAPRAATDRRRRSGISVRPGSGHAPG